MKPTVKRVQEFYDANILTEWHRLECCPVEYAITTHLLQEHLPPPPARIIDIGGGPGRYSIDLLKAGFQVSLVDLSPANIEFARLKAEESNLQFELLLSADASEPLPFSDESFDAVLMMGPLYHLTTLEQRHQALKEASRIMKPNAPIFAAFITLFGAVQSIIINGPQNIEAEWETMQFGINNPDLGFTEAYFARPAEIENLMTSFHRIEMVGVEGCSNNFQQNFSNLDSNLWQKWLELNLQFGRSSTALEASNHIVFIGKK